MNRRRNENEKSFRSVCLYAFGVNRISKIPTKTHTVLHIRGEWWPQGFWAKRPGIGPQMWSLLPEYSLPQSSPRVVPRSRARSQSRVRCLQIGGFWPYPRDRNGQYFTLIFLPDPDASITYGY